jgi:predicted acyltransferase (DUF342 family)
MAQTAFNVVGGLSVGSSQIQVIDANGNLVLTNSSNVDLGNVANVHIAGGTSGQHLMTDGNGSLSWATVSTSGLSNGTTQVDIDDSSDIRFSVGGNANTAVFNSNGNITLKSGAALKFGNTSTMIQNSGNDIVITLNSSNALSGLQLSGTGRIKGTNGQVIAVAGTDTFNIAQKLTVGSVTANTGIKLISNASSSHGITIFPGTSANYNLVLPASTGANGQTLITDGNGQLSFADIVEGTNTQVQFNDSGYMGAVAEFTFDKSTNTLATTNLTLGGNATVGGTLGVTGNVSVANVAASGALAVTGNTTVTNISASGNSAVTGNATVTGTLGVTGNASVGNISASGAASVGGNATVTGTLGVTGNTSVTNIAASGNATVTGNVAVTGELAVSGDTTVAYLQASDGITVTASGITVTGNSSVTGSFLVTGNAAATGSLSATGNVSGNNLSVTNNANIGGTANVVGAAAFGSTVDIAGNTTVTGNLVVQQKASISGDLEISGNIIVSGNTSYQNVTTTATEDPFIMLGANNAANLVELGLYGVYSNTNYTGWARDHNDGIWKLFNTTVAPTNTVDWANVTYSTAKFGSVQTTANISVGNVANVGGNLNVSGAAAVTGNVTANNVSLTNNIDGKEAIFTQVSANKYMIGDTLPTSYMGATTATTTSITAGQVIAKVPAVDGQAIEFRIKGIDGTNKFQTSTITALVGVAASDQVDHTEYGTVIRGSAAGSLNVAIVDSHGNVALTVSPTSSNSTVWTVQYRSL